MATHTHVAIVEWLSIAFEYPRPPHPSSSLLYLGLLVLGGFPAQLGWAWSSTPYFPSPKQWSFRLTFT